MPRDAGRHPGLGVPEEVPEEWLARYGSTPRHAPGGSGSTSGTSRRDDARRVGLALAVCVAVFVATIVGLVLPAAGLRGLVAALALLAVVFGACLLLARLVLDRWSAPAPRPASPQPRHQELALRREDLDELVAGWRAASGRLAAAVVAVAFVVSLPLLAVSRQPPVRRFVAPLWFLGGVLAVVVLLGRLLAGVLARRH